MSILTGIDDIPAAWRTLLSDVRRSCPTAVIGGGALRDLDNGRPVKDVDIFIRAEGEQAALRQIELLCGAGFNVTTNYDEAGKVYPDDQNLEVSVIADLDPESDDCPPVQLIFTTWDTDRIIERFDYGICRLAFDGETIVRPAEYDEDKAAQVFRLRRERSTPLSMRGSVHRFARLTAEKYAGWTWWPFDEYVGRGQ